jgi:hypothetical protein
MQHSLLELNGICRYPVVATRGMPPIGEEAPKKTATRSAEKRTAFRRMDFK